MKAKTLLIRNAKTPDGKPTDVLIIDGRIAKLCPNIQDAAETVIEGDGAYLFPAFVDMHAHLREPGQEYKEDVTSGAKSAVRGGFGAVACMPNTSPVVDSPALVKYLMTRGEETNLCKILPIGAVTKGQKGTELAEIRLMAEAGAVAFSDDGVPVSDSRMMRFALEYAGNLGMLIISHAEDVSLTDKGVANEGANATRAGLRGITRASEEVAIARDVILASTLNVPVHIAHVSTKGSIAIIRAAKAAGVRVTCETCPHYFSATDSLILDYNTNSKINPPLRTDADVEAVIEGIADGTIDAIATDHAPHHIDDKAVEYDKAKFGTIGFESAYGLAVTKLVLTKRITIGRLSELMSTNPARILKQDDFGSVCVGGAANITLADTVSTYTFDVKKTAGKSRNSLFDGWKLTGLVRATIVGGDIKYLLK